MFFYLKKIHKYLYSPVLILKDPFVFSDLSTGNFGWGQLESWGKIPTIQWLLIQNYPIFNPHSIRRIIFQLCKNQI